MSKIKPRGKKLALVIKEKTPASKCKSHEEFWTHEGLQGLFIAFVYFIPH
ncbi:MAG: hypothetical protein MRERC_2c020 [Mycoplasmataceae bacterium RC_NB112A]|nr:MAG: hypothetical protein MRERC_6c081 [Mycoplasmataceae bacterium RC_NB112A]KLL02145.1 MAG: hypothetical protein MRERC_4c109 [Mycoplasmataceae bacterium RC_NB112A]KLL02164.1 MAG: hypothetical protein MRERC_4c134 [Mycoplasmataceae bacterium RC_NB112A]KLL02306.1 MAG: hypothetical protein MRERC_2c020 [Mycoplasmataceae bacterium RC_NB112A]